MLGSGTSGGVSEMEGRLDVLDVLACCLFARGD